MCTSPDTDLCIDSLTNECDFGLEMRWKREDRARKEG